MLQHLDWLIPNVMYQADDAAGGGGNATPEIDTDKDDEIDDELDVTTKLSELKIETLDELMDREDIDIAKYLEWMKTRDEETTIESVLIVEDDKDDDKKDDKTDEEKAQAKAEAAKKEADTKERDQTVDSEGKPEKKVEVDSKVKTDDDTTVDDKTKTKTIKISDDYIIKQVQNFRDQMKDYDPALIEKKVGHFNEVLNGIKGGEMDSRALKNYINAQMYIKTIKSPFDADWKPDSKVVEDPEYIKKATEQKQKMIQDRVKALYSDFPDDALQNDEALKEFEENLSRRDFSAYEKSYNMITSEIDKDYDRYVHVVNNWEEIAKDTITTDVKLFEARISKINLSLKDLGIDSLDLDEKDLYNEYLWNNVLFLDGKTDKPDNTILTFMDDVIPIVKPGTVYNKLLDLNLELILGQKEHAARTKAFKAGLNNMEDPSTSEQSGMQHRDKVEIDEESFTDDTTPDQDQEKLDQLKEVISKSSGAKVSKRKK